MRSSGATWPLPGVPTHQAKDLFEEFGIPLPTSLTYSQVVLSDPPDYGLVELVRNLLPGDIWPSMSDWIATTIGKMREA